MAHAAWDDRMVQLDVPGVEVLAYEVVHLVEVPAVAPVEADEGRDCAAKVRGFVREAP